MKQLLLSFLFLMSMEQGKNQTINIPAKMAGYASFKNADLLFVHTDKHIYTNNELLWFSAWLLRCGQDSLPFHRLLSLSLVPADTHIPAVQQKFVMLGGFSYGSVQLPDSMAPGEYKLVAYTNMIGRDSFPVAVFTQDLSIRSLRQSDFVANSTILEDTTGRKDLLITVKDKITSRPVRDAELFLWSEGSKTIHAKTNKDGIYRQELSAMGSANTVPGIVNTKIKFHGDIEYLQNKLPGAIAERQLEIRFYPEGGYLLSNTPCRIGWESKTDKGEPVAVRAVVFENHKSIDTIITNEQGLGAFTLVPKATASYSIRPLTWPTAIGIKEGGYPLQTVLQKGMAVSVPHAVTGDSLLFRIYATGYASVNMVVHNFRTVFEQQTLPAKEGGLPVLLLLDRIPKGLTAITLLDSNNHPLAERIFFAHYNSKALLIINSDQKIYEKRQKVTLTFQLTNNQLPAAGFASVSCAQANRFDNSKQQDIETFGFLNAELQDIPAYSLSHSFSDAAYLENVLLVRGWRRYTWQELLADAHQPPAFHTPVIGGKVIPRYGKIKKALTVSIIGGNTGASFITTDAAGNFECTYEQLQVHQDKKLWMSAGDKDEGNKVMLQDPFPDINTKVASLLQFRPVDADRYLQYAQDMLVNDLSRVKQLALVTVTAKRATDASIYRVANACGDYVCVANILNCINHTGDPRNHAPVKGKMYNLNRGGSTVYWGCAAEDDNAGSILLLDGIKTGKEFYVENFNENTTGIPEYISTLYWSPALNFDANGKATCSFYTSDITGRFRITVNGITGENLFYATGSIEVK